MFDPYPDLVSTHTLTLPSGEGITFDQTLWGKVIAVRELSRDGGRYLLEDAMSTAPLRRLLEAATVGGLWAFAPDDRCFMELRREVLELLDGFYG
jgi:hypothetical protein